MYILGSSREGIDRIGGVGEREERGGMSWVEVSMPVITTTTTRHKLWRARHNMRCVIVLTGIVKPLTLPPGGVLLSAHYIDLRRLAWSVQYKRAGKQP